MATWTNQTKNSTTFTQDVFSGGAWDYSQPLFTYNSTVFQAKTPYYNSLGVGDVWTNQTKNATSFSNQTKN